MSERASTSSSSFSGVALFLLSPFLICGSGDAILLLGVEPFPSIAELCEGEVGSDPGPWEVLCDSRLSASLFSNVPKSVLPLSSSLSNPEKHQ